MFQGVPLREAGFCPPRHSIHSGGQRWLPCLGEKKEYFSPLAQSMDGTWSISCQ
jgi:hypothetical protein